MSNLISLRGEKINEVAVTGEVIYESLNGSVNKKLLKSFIHREVVRKVKEIQDPLLWASYLVIFSPGQEVGEVRCQVDVETDRDRAGFAIGYGGRANHAFNDAIDRMQWYEKNIPMKLSM